MKQLRDSVGKIYSVEVKNDSFSQNQHVIAKMKLPKGKYKIDISFLSKG